ncbi:T9SS type A sorting domain-containing protein [bacterium]|nr:T9SS type A sorting domain-containing protein [bacterium]
MKIITSIILTVLVFYPMTVFAAQSANYILKDSVVNSGGNTQSTASRSVLSSVGETIVGQIWGGTTSSQAGFFNDYFIAPPTPTVTPTVTVTMTPIREFGGELITKKWVYAAPNPIRGHIGHIYFHLSEPADVEIKVYTTSNQLVISKRWDMRPAGKNYWQWNMSNLANGVYIMRVKAKNGNRTTIVKKKIALIK